MSQCIAAYTPMCGSGEYYPAYINVSRISNKPDADVVISVRGKESPPGTGGPYATIVLSVADFKSLIRAAQERLDNDDPGRVVPPHGSGP